MHTERDIHDEMDAQEIRAAQAVIEEGRPEVVTAADRRPTISDLQTFLRLTADPNRTLDWEDLRDAFEADFASDEDGVYSDDYSGEDQ